MGAWIETRYIQTRTEQMEVAPLVGAWIETSSMDISIQFIKSHPSWVRGLKLQPFVDYVKFTEVAPLVGAWIETYHLAFYLKSCFVAPLVGAWIETFC